MTRPHRTASTPPVAVLSTDPPPAPSDPTQPAADVARASGLPQTLRRQLLYVTLAYGFGSYWLWTVSGAALTQFARALHMPDSGFGILATLPFLGTLLQIPASYALERYGHRKWVFIVTSCIGRLMWTVTALIPWILPGVERWWWPTMLVTLLIAWAAAHAGVPAWMNWMSDLIPRRLRGRYFAVRNLIGQPIGLLVTLVVGYLLDIGAGVQELRPDIMLKITSALLGISGLVGMLDILCFRRVHDHKPPQPQRATGLLSLMGAPLRDANFRRYLTFNFIFTFGVGFIGQYIWLYVFDIVGWSNWQANLLLLGVPLVMRMASYRLWGRLTDRLGKKPVLLITGVITVFGTVGWLLITPERFWVGYTLVTLTVIAVPGLEIANFNFILDMAGSRREAARSKEGFRKATQSEGNASGGGSAYVALNSMAVAVGGIVSGLLSSVIATGFAELHWALPWFGMVLTYHGILFILSTLLRAASLVWAMGLTEPQASGTRDAIRYMTVSFYSNARHAVQVPMRAVGRVTRWSYRIERQR